MIKASDYIAAFIQRTGVRHVFSLAGGHIMHLMDSIARNPSLVYVTVLHEQAGAMMAKVYSRATQNYGFCLVTSGPGGTNTVTGVASAWQDSTPCMFISGQFRAETLPLRSGIRHAAPQQYFPVEIVKPITKYAALVTDAQDIRYHLEKAYFLSRTGRPGPVWLDIPLDVQGTEIEEESLRGFDSLEAGSAAGSAQEPDPDVLSKFWDLLRSAKRPVVLAGNGIRLSSSQELLRAFVERYNIPLLTSLSGVDLIEDTHPLFMGRPNYWGQRHANFIVQNCDLLIALGAGLHFETTGYNFRAFARAATKVVVDVDPAELQKDTVRVDLGIRSDCKAFLESTSRSGPFHLPRQDEWLTYCNRLKTKFPVAVREIDRNGQFVNPYAFFDVLSDVSTERDVIIPGNAGMHFTVAVQAFRVKRGQRVLAEIGAACMGHSIPASIAASLAFADRRVICVTGDGGMQVNIQELQTMIGLGLPVKLFVADNGGYMSLVNTQKKYFNGRLIGCNRESGLTLPNIEKILTAYGFEVDVIRNNVELREKISRNLASRGCFASIVKFDPEAAMAPIVPSKLLKNGNMVSRPLEELAPLLPDEEFDACMLIPRFVEE